MPRFALAGLALLCAIAPLSAQTYTWDPNKTGAQTWDTTTLNWDTGGGPSTVAWQNGAGNTAALGLSSGTANLTAAAAITAGQLRVGSDGFTLTTGTTTANYTFNQGVATVGGARGLTLSVASASTTGFVFTGTGDTSAGALNLTVNSAVVNLGLTVNSSNAFGTTPNATITLAQSTAVGSGGTTLMLGNNVTLASGVSVALQSDGTNNFRSRITTTGTATVNGNVSVSSAAGAGFTQLNSDTNGVLTVNGNVTTAAGTPTLVIRGTSTQANTISGVISGGARLTKTDAGTWRLNQDANTFTGQVQVAVGVLQVTRLANAGVASSLGTGSTASAITLGQNDTNTNALQYVGGTASSTNRVISLTGNATNSLLASGTSASATVTYAGNVTHAGTAARGLELGGANAGNNTISGLIQTTGAGGTLNVSKTGTGTWVLSGNNTYAGTTTVSAGTLVVNGSHSGTGAVTVSGGTLGGTGTLAGAVTASGGTVRGDSAAGTGDLTLNGGATVNATAAAGTRGTLATQLAVDNAGVITDNSQLAFGTSTLNFAGVNTAGNTFSIRLLNDGGLVNGQQYTITLATASSASNFQRDGSGSADFLASDFTLLSAAGWTFDGVSLTRNTTNNTLVLAFTPVPEPSGLLAAAGVAIAAAAGWRRWRKR